MKYLYKPLEERTLDYQYHDLLKHIREKGRTVSPIQGGKSKMVMGYQMRFPMKNGAPIITERNLMGKEPNGLVSGGVKGALGEHLGFLNGARTLEQLVSFGCPKVFWERWVTDEKCAQFGLQTGDLGDGSYGAAWATFPTAEGYVVNQIKNVVEQIKRAPHLRTHFISPWIPQYCVAGAENKRCVVVAPCHGWLHVLVFPEEGTLHVHHYQRSADTPVGLAFNLVQYTAFGLMLAQVTGYEFEELVYTLSDAHMYECQYDPAQNEEKRDYVSELLARPPRPFPKLILNPDVNDIFAFRVEDFELVGYDPHPGMKIPTPV